MTEFEKRTPPSAVPPDYSRPIRRSRLSRWIRSWFLPRCPTCHYRAAEDVERRGSFIIYRCSVCGREWKDMA